VQVGQGAVAGLGSLFGAALSSKTPTALKALYSKKRLDFFGTAELQTEASSEQNILVPSGPLQTQLEALTSLSERCVRIISSALGALASAKLVASAGTASATSLSDVVREAVAVLTEGLATLRETLEPPAFRAALKGAVGDVDAAIVRDVAKAQRKCGVPEDGTAVIAKVMNDVFHSFWNYCSMQQWFLVVYGTI
jgi:hypothetical protein